MLKYGAGERKKKIDICCDCHCEINGMNDKNDISTAMITMKQNTHDTSI